MSVVEREYNEAIDQMSGAERVLQTISIYESMYRMIAHQVRKETPGLNSSQLKWQVAQRMYLTDSATQELLSRVK